ncbi:hypothetical protein Tco_0725987 [Tanacetum coccineum]|uniref:Uncharacterized protein n=1 Tax=Tanacetum coccineum TaxID=301880 RepID=A0ABQ4YFD5_9ASTR
MLEVVTTLEAEEAHSTSPHSRDARDAQGTTDQSAAQASISQGTAEVQGTDNSQGTAKVQGTAEVQGTAAVQGTADFQVVEPVVKHHAFWVESQHLKKQKRRRKKHKKKVSSAKLGRNKEEGTLSEEHYVQDDYTADPFFEDIVDKDAAVTPDLERKSDGTEEINIEEKKASDVKSGDTEELDLEAVQSTARQSTITPRTLNFNDEAGPSSPIRPTQNIEPEEQFKVDEVLADISLNISRPRGLSIPGPIQPQPQQPSQATDPKDKGKGILVARKIQAEWDAEEERKRFEELKKAKPKTTLRKPTSLAQERNQMMNFLKGQGYKNLQKLKYPQMKELLPKYDDDSEESRRLGNLTVET